jgi:hypothetical protein
LEEWRVQGRRDLADLYADWWDAYDDLRLNRDLPLVREFRHRFAQQGFNFDLLYVEIREIPMYVEWPDLKELLLNGLRGTFHHWRAVNTELAALSPFDAFLGYDVATPLPTFHSALHSHSRPKPYPGYLSEALNSHGLLDSLELALRFAEDSAGPWNANHAHCVMGIWRLE